MPDNDPLPISVLMAEHLGFECCCGCEAEWEGDSAAAFIDAKLRPLVEALQKCRRLAADSVDYSLEAGNASYAGNDMAIESICISALKAAGVE